MGQYIDGEQYTDMQIAFIEFYLGEAQFNATDAAELAGYKGDRNQLGVVGHENLNKPKIQKYIRRRLDSIAMSADETLYRLSRIARGDAGSDREVTTRDILSALKMLGKLHAMFTEKVEHTGDVNLRVVYDEGPDG